MPRFLEDKLKAEYGENSKIPYKVMNAKGYMRGSQETAKGAALDAKHERDMAAGTSSRQLHPALRERSQMVKQAHQHLMKEIPGFRDLPRRQQFMAHQEHVRTRMKGR